MRKEQNILNNFDYGHLLKSLDLKQAIMFNFSDMLITMVELTGFFENYFLK